MRPPRRSMDSRRHSTGEWAGQPFDLQPWQQFVVGSVFGWKRSDGLRRFRTAYVEVARKNGKSALLAGIALIALSRRASALAAPAPADAGTTSSDVDPRPPEVPADAFSALDDEAARPGALR